LTSSYWIDNLGFITEGKLATIFIKPSLGVSNWPVIYYTQSSFLASSSPRHHIALFIISLGIDSVHCNPSIIGKPRDGKVPILPSTTRRGTTLNTSVMSKLLTPPHAHATHTATSAKFENAFDNFDDASTVLDESGSLGSFLDAKIARTKQMGTLLHLLVYMSLENVLVMILRKLILSLMMNLLKSFMLLAMQVLSKIFLQDVLLDISCVLMLSLLHLP
jgi:hypothetical protein